MEPHQRKEFAAEKALGAERAGASESLGQGEGGLPSLQFVPTPCNRRFMESFLFLSDLLTGHEPPPIVRTRQDADWFQTLSARSPPGRGEGVGPGAPKTVKSLFTRHAAYPFTGSPDLQNRMRFEAMNLPTAGFATTLSVPTKRAVATPSPSGRGMG